MLRYYHIKELQKRMIDINKELGIHGDQSEDFIYWDEFRTAVMTTNPKHMSSGLSVLHFYTDIMATSFAILFCSAITIVQFCLIPNRKEYDYLGLGIVGLTVAACLVIYIYTSTNSDSFTKWIHQRALERRIENNKNDSDIIRTP